MSSLTSKNNSIRRITGLGLLFMTLAASLFALAGTGGVSNAGADVDLPPTMNAMEEPIGTPGPTWTPAPTITPTYVIQGTYTPPAQPPAFPIPEMVPLMEDDDQIVNILLLGSDSNDNMVRRTDVIILLSINKAAGTAAMWHVPRDLFVYIPNYTMDRINVAYGWGVTNGYAGSNVIKDVFRYNFGIQVDFFARVDYNDFKEIVDYLGGLVVSVDCALKDWRLKEPELDPAVEENWEQYTLEIGRQRLDADTALWYVRSRQSTSDLDRGRRQMDVLRAMWVQAREMGIFAQVTQLWPMVTGVVETDLTLTDVIELAPLAMNMDMAQVARYSGEVGVHYIRTYTPDDGRDVQIPNNDELLPMVRDLLTPPTENRLARQVASVDVVDGSWYGIGFERVAADRLAWEGFAATPVEGLGPINRELTVIYDYTGQMKGGVLADLQRILRVEDAQVMIEPDPNRTVDYRVEIGTAYRSCIYSFAEDEIPGE
ncbi:MAG TPA: LCP family protein [Aggregatilineaceae bacterium]|nr:LCP family protein [Aggregatilineaceae bacterium]